MPNYKISGLTAYPNSTFASTDRFEVSYFTGGIYYSRYLTGTQIIATVVAQTITNGVTTSAPSQDVVFDALALKEASLPTMVGQSLKVLRVNAGETAKEWATISSGLTVGTTAIASGTVGRVLFEGAGNVLQQDSTLFWDNTNKRLGVGETPNTSTRLDVRAQGALSTDIAFRVRNSADTFNLFNINGTDCVWSNGKGGEVGTTAFGELTITTRSTGTSNTIFGYQGGNILTSGSNNTMVGYRAGGGVLGSSFTGNSNTLIGSGAGLYLSSGIQNTFIGANSGTSITTGSYNVIIGGSTSFSAGLAQNIIISDGASIQGFKKDSNHNIILGQESALAATATNGFQYCRGGAGVPTGVPATAITGHVPMYVDTTNSKMYIYSGGAWVILN